MYTALSNSSIALVIECAIEFVCAQSPYSMRGLMSGFVTLTISSGVARRWQRGQLPPLFLDLYYSAQGILLQLAS